MLVGSIATRTQMDAFTSMTTEPNLPDLIAALTEIRRRAMDHPCFAVDCFERRDIAGLCELGGDICDWTMVAIVADDALKGNE